MIKDLQKDNSSIAFLKGHAFKRYCLLLIFSIFFNLTAFSLTTVYRDGYVLEYSGSGENPAYDFRIHNNNITVENPFIEFSYLDYRDKKGLGYGSNAPAALRNIYIDIYVGGNWINVGKLPITHEEMQTFRPEYGALAYVDVWRLPQDNRLRMAKMRFFVGAESLKPGRSIQKIRVRGEMDWDNDNKGPHTILRYTANVGVNFSRPDGTLTRHKSGMMNFKASGISAVEGNWINVYEFGTETASEYYAAKVLDKAATSIDFEFKKRHALFNNNLTEYIYTNCLCERNLDVRNNSGGSTSNNVVRIKQRFVTPQVKHEVKGFIKPESLNITSDQWSRTFNLKWAYQNNGSLTDGDWTVYRKTSSGSLLYLNKFPLSTTEAKYTLDPAEAYDLNNEFIVSFSPRNWPTSAPIADLNRSQTVKIVRDITLALSQKSGQSSISLELIHDAIKDPNAVLIFYRKEGANGDYKEIHKISNIPSTIKKQVFEDKDVKSCSNYTYKVVAHFLSTQKESNITSGQIKGSTEISSFQVSKGTYGSTVKLKFNVNQIGTAGAIFTLERKVLNGVDDYREIYRTSGVMDSYFYDDNMAVPGQYYQYRVSAIVKCDGQSANISNMMEDVGFSQNSGVISGRISYGTGVSVPEVKVHLIKNQEDDARSQFSSLLVTGAGTGAVWNIDSQKAARLFVGKPFTVQMWVNPDPALNSPEGNIILDAHKAFSLGLGEYNATTKRYKLLIYEGTGSASTKRVSTNLTIPADAFSHIGLRTDGKSRWSVFVANANNEVQSEDFDVYRLTSWTTDSKYKEKGVYVGGSADLSAAKSFKGNIDDVRFWDKELDNSAILKNYNRILHGEEQGLILYWPMDEGLNGHIFDISKSGGVANENHAVATLAKTSDIVPTLDQLSIYGLTDINGNYTIRGVPFSGGGSTYSIVPSFGIHAFAPIKESRFFNNSSLNHSGVNFEDISSFAVSGSVYYENTQYPVAGANLYVDGTICSKNGKAIETNAEGMFDISVPIGDHYIEVRKQGHTFKFGGRYPADPENVETRVTFEKPLSNLAFYDNTKVTITGRVSGGNIEEKKPFGFGVSKANLGKAKIVLTTGYPMNVIEDSNAGESGSVFNPEVLVYDVPSEFVKSKTYAGAGNADDVLNITIITDSLTGEFAASVPPVKYDVQSVEIVSNDEIKFEKGQFGVIDVTNPLLSFTDSTEVNGKLEKFRYNASFRATHREKPVFTVRDKSNNSGAFGELIYEVEEVGSKDSIELYTVEEGKVNYTFDHPVFIKMGKYSFELKGYEEYTNLDDPLKPLVDRVPLENTVVTITNELSASQEVYVEGSNDGAFHGDLKENQLALDSLGVATYNFTAGFPNIVEPFTRGLNITYENNGKQLQWDGNSTFKGIILGGLPTGSNFVTAGPDKIMMILRDPSGSNSNAYMEKGVTITNKEQDGGSFITQNEVTTITKLGVTATTITGTPGFGVIMEAQASFDLEVGLNLNYEYTGYKEWQNTVTTTERISTSDDPDYVGAMGDVFVGTSTNILFGNSRNVTISKKDGRYVVEKVDALSTSTQFTTGFKYTQYYIEEVLIPNLQKIRNSLLTKVDQTSPVSNPTKSPVYLTTLSEEDERFGSNNFDKDVWGENAVSRNLSEGPSYKMVLPDNPEDKLYDDSIRWCNSQIDMWINTLAENEQQKVKVINERDKWLDQNHSFDAGAIIESSTQICDSETTNNAHEFESLAVVGGSSGGMINGTGVAVTGKTTTGARYFGSEENTTETCLTVGYSLVESGFNDALTVDVYRAPDGFGPIFRTRGGQTSCPFEGQEVTKYFRPGFEISAATMQIEVPEITAENTFATEIPSGKSANFEIKLRNLSETDDDIWFDLALNDETNPNGAVLKMDGQAITDGRAILVPAGKTIVKTLQLSQSDLGVLEFNDIELVLKSQCQGDPTGTRPHIADTIKLSAQFVPSCSDVTLQIDNRVLNARTGSILDIRIKDYEMGYKNFKGLRLQYKGERDIDWKLIQEYVVNDEDLTDNNKKLEGGTTNYSFDMGVTALYPDQTYKFRAITLCAFGNELINNESETIDVIKDMRVPVVMGKPSPSNGILTSENEVSLMFNEPVKSSSLTDLANFSVKGILNGYKVAHSVAMKLQGGSAAFTEAEIDLTKKDFSIDLWVNRTSDGTLIAHGNRFSQWKVSVNKDGKFVLEIDNNKYTSVESVPENQWTFISMSYEQKADIALFTATMAYGSFTKILFNAVPVAKYEGRGRMMFGEKMNGAMHEVTFWDRARSFSEAQAKMYESKKPGTPNLAGYWKMDEGHGLKAADAVRGRHIILPAASSWYLQNENKAPEFKGNDYIALNLSKTPLLTDEDFALEFWFRGAKQSDKAMLFSMNDSLLNVSVDASGRITLMAKGEEYPISDKVVMDENWHHFALNVLRNGNAVIYIDGEVAKQIAPAAIPALATDRLILGAARYQGDFQYEYRNYFTGAMDEVRIWRAQLSADVIRAGQYNRLSGSEDGLIAYYPFEKQQLDSGNQLETVPSFEDHSSREAGQAEYTESLIIGDLAPGLKEARVMTNVNFSFTASDSKIIIDVNEDPDIIEGCTLYFTVKDVRDLNGNLSVPVTWSAFVNANQLKWNEESVQLKKQVEEELSFNVSIVNTSGVTENWSLQNLPSWLRVSADAGQLKPLSEKRLTFTVDPSVAIGKYEECLYLTGNNKISESLSIALTVTGQAPDWKVDPADYEYSMNITGQVSINNIPSQDSDDLIAAFIDDVCVGIASPVYFQRYDSYYALMDVYGNSSSLGKPVTFRIWDAGTGNIHPLVSSSVNVVFADNKVEGTISNPVIWNAKDMIEQLVDLKRGWNWTSLFVHNSEDMSVSSMFETIKPVTEIVKSKSAFAIPSADGWAGDLNTISVGAMYKVKSTEQTSLKATGKPVTPAESPLTIRNNWNWIGYNGIFVISLNDAFASLNPEDGDFVKGHSGFAMYNGYEWVGSLKLIAPGRGYLYQSLAKEDKQLTYPNSAPELKSSMMKASVNNGVFKPVSENKYSGNMTMIIAVTDQGVALDQAEIGVFADGECRAANQITESGLAFLTIAGEGIGSLLEFKVAVNGEMVNCSEQIQYVDDAMIGSLKAPYVIDINPLSIGLNEQSVNVYPTLVKDHTFVKAQGVNLQSISVMDLNGVVLFTETNPQGETRIDLSTYSQGVYLILVKTEKGEQKIYRVVKQR